MVCFLCITYVSSANPSSGQFFVNENSFVVSLLNSKKNILVNCHFGFCPRVIVGASAL